MEKALENMNKKEKILTIARFIIENNATIAQTANNFNCSTSSIKKYINNQENLPSIDYNAYLLIKDIQERLQKIGRICGGITGKRGSSISEYEIEEIAKTMIEKGFTLEEASLYFDNIPTSTLYENLQKITDLELKTNLENLFKENKSFAGGRK